MEKLCFQSFSDLYAPNNSGNWDFENSEKSTSLSLHWFKYIYEYTFDQYFSKDFKGLQTFKYLILKTKQIAAFTNY